MDDAEKILYADVVKLVNRTNEPLEFKWDSVTYMLPPRGSKMFPRHIALKGIKDNNTKLDASTGLVSESLMGIDEEGSIYPCDMIGDVNLEEIKEMPKLDTDQEDIKLVVDGKDATMQSQPVRGRGRGRPKKNLAGAVS